MTRRDFLSAAAACGAGMLTGCASGRAGGGTAGGDFSYDPKAGLHLPWAGLERPVRLKLVTDTHLGLSDDRDADHRDHIARMAQWPGKTAAFRASLDKAKADGTDLIVLTGDNISFPTLANVEFLKASLDACGTPWIYVAGNHDWHFEGEAGSDLEQRARWTKARLKPLYQGADPIMASRVVKGVRVVTIDNSAYHVLPEQVDFFRAEAAKGEPVVLAMHIPFWQPGWSVCTCACPTWGAANDPYWQIERRERWAETNLPSTLAFRETVLSTPNLVAVLAGHIHAFQAARDHGRNLFTGPANSRGDVLNVTIDGNMP